MFRQCIDLHVHIGPEVIPRKYNVDTLIQAEAGNISAMALKNHFFPTLPLIDTVPNNTNLRLIGSIVLNNAVGGVNPEAVYATSTIAQGRPFIVWFPTTNANQFLCNCEYEIAPEWVNQPGFSARKATSIKGITIAKRGEISKKAKLVCDAISNTNGILATGHISQDESMALVNYARSIGLSKIIITHPIYQKIAMSLEKQTYLANLGCYLEHCYSMYSIDRISIRRISEQINLIGAERCILSSDVGQQFSPPPSQALLDFSTKLVNEGISLQQLETMLVRNPTTLIS